MFRYEILYAKYVDLLDKRKEVKKTGNSVYRGSKEHIFWVHGLKSKILGFLHLQITIMLYVKKLGLLPDAG
jgi:hypothetical protein